MPNHIILSCIFLDILDFTEISGILTTIYGLKLTRAVKTILDIRRLGKDKDKFHPFSELNHIMIKKIQSLKSNKLS